ncbi:tRNA epoxyqueuosine(34) reductase QueG [Lyngbya sp. CCAP 1446/10]|uniref:tRNA epoxyqueuosine(34) reductase QueG n=1 Tax=Lyngbya sp. CCAP 1446/10 TaxID=439293 RepID=UPI002237D97F|nr:tRNA epoxyqueuosine(34) reductase QueG [Lyngbya sp. CCAP 1446/10]MCW6049290.1 tRNA epoxyqueuosine(34) reductase QueG [Lyngbya sp. CCAP 1446/10]
MKISINSDLIKQKALELGFHKVGLASAQEETQVDAQRLQAWLDKGYQADMAWMANPKRLDIRSLMPDVQSVICVAINYYTPHQRPDNPPFEGGDDAAIEYAKISRYGWGRDYHKILHKKLKLLANWVRSQAEGIEARYYADTGPIQDKMWAQRAGIGWIAKNGNVISREYGSWVFLGEILTNLELAPDAPHTEHCGTCTRCIEACPTGAITEPFVVNADRCIAYHTIENRAKKLPDEIASNLQGWVAGCDVCQDVCPWNQRFAKPTDVAEFEPYPENIAPTLAELEEISDEEWNRRFTASALRRIKPEMLRRNAKASQINSH